MVSIAQHGQYNKKKGQTFVIGGSIQYPINNNLETFNKSNYKIL